MIYRILMVAEVEAADEGAALTRLDGYREFANDSDLEVCLMRAEPGDVTAFKEALDDCGRPCFVPAIQTGRSECPECGERMDDVESTICGSMCGICRMTHAVVCEVCRRDFAERGIL